jgi:ADP-heptose:LPS heptosyltransferase
MSRILVFRLGSLGDAVVSLPALHLLAAATPGAERILLTNQPVSAQAAPAAELLIGTGLLHRVIEFPPALRSPGQAWDLRQRIRAESPEALVYLSEPKPRPSLLRDVGFFATCGIFRMIGLPWSDDRRRHRPQNGRWESEAGRLVRCLEDLGSIDLTDRAAWDLHLSDDEGATAGSVLAGWPGADNFAAFAIGTKHEANDWGDDAWMETLRSADRPSLGLALIGAEIERERLERVATAWSGPVLNLAGCLPLRVTAAVLARARVFIGHDSGPMHLAAAAGTPVCAVFSGRNKPGIWFPAGTADRILYPLTDCVGCGGSVCEGRAHVCMTEHRPADVAALITSITDPL